MSAVIQNTKPGFGFVLFIPIVHALATLTVNYFEPGTFNPGTLRAIIIGVFLLWFVPNKFAFKGLNKTVSFFLLYVLLLVFLSSNVFFSFYTYIKVFVSLMMLPVGIYYFNNFDNLLKLNKTFIIAISLYSINLIISNYFQLGSSDYLEGSVYFGSGRVNIAKNVALLLLTVPIFYLYGKPKNKFWYYLSVLVIFTGIILVLLAVKRAGILSLLIGFFVYFLLSPSKGKKIKQLIVIAILGIITSSIYLEPLISRYEAREERFEFRNPEFAEGENRVKEYDMVLNDLKTRNIFSFLFGREIFNDRAYYNTRRMLHTDYMIWLSGAGIIGFIWYFYLFNLIFMKIYKYSAYLKFKQYRELRAVSLALIIGILILSIAGTIYTVEILSNLFLYLGAIIGVLRASVLKEFNKTPTLNQTTG